MSSPSKACLLWPLTLCAAAGLPAPAAAEEFDCSGSKVSKGRPQSEIIRPGDRPDHELRQSIRTHVFRGPNPDFDGAEQTAYAHEDLIAGAGTSVGYFKYDLPGGETLWARFESVFKTNFEPPWQTNYQGVIRFVAGTGKYKGIHGGGHYEGVITANGFREQATCHAEF